MTQRTQRAPAWDGDIDRRLTERLQDRGFATATAYADASPTTSLVTLAATLGADDVAAVQLERRLFEEARDRKMVERHLRDLLVRSLHEFLPDGWRHDWGRDIPGDVTTPWARRARTFAHWAPAGWLSEYQAAIDHIIDVIVDSPATIFPEGWIPRDADDPVLVEFFRQHWSGTKPRA